MAATNEHFSSGGQTVSLDVFLPAASGKPPAVLILHGSFGLLPQYRADIVSFAEALAEAGIGATMPHYLESTKTDPGIGVLSLIPTKSPAWRQACSDALTLMANDARFDGTRLGILGFSLGGNLALSLAMDPPAGTPLKCVVDFFGPTQSLAPHWSKLPPVLIFHGTKDQLVDPSESARLVAQLELAGKKKGSDYIFESYEGEGHGFKGAALTKSREAAVEFIKKRLAQLAKSAGH
jgi:dienelactone hydrolase